MKYRVGEGVHVPQNDIIPLYKLLSTTLRTFANLKINFYLNELLKIKICFLVLLINKFVDH